MSETGIPIHYVCTLEEGRRLIERQTRFWVSNCGCREGNPQGCRRSRIDVCLFWAEHDAGSGTDKHPVTRVEVEAILAEAQAKRLVTRPFRNEARTDTDGICFCCDDCCGYFQDRDAGGNPKYACDKGELVETTRMEECTHCGECAPVCYFNARRMRDGRLELDRGQCYGCGLCVDVCPAGCITMTRRG
jgi:ferredoxin